jgi:hypothetical protein
MEFTGWLCLEFASLTRVREPVPPSDWFGLRFSKVERYERGDYKATRLPPRNLACRRRSAGRKIKAQHLEIVAFWAQLFRNTGLCETSITFRRPLR